MQRLTREHRFRNHGDLSTLPAQPPLSVALGERFTIETVDTGDMLMLSAADRDKPCGPMAGNPSTGPVFVKGIAAGEVIAVHIEELKVVGLCKIGIGEETLLPNGLVTKRTDVLSFHGNRACFSGGLSAPIRPMFGCFGVVPAQPSPEPWHHGGNMDLPSVCAGSVVHLRAEREGAWFCCGDGHAVQGDAEINGYSLEVSLDARLRIEKSAWQDAMTILIETPTEVIAVGIEKSFADSIRTATHSMADFVSRRRGVSLLDAYQMTSHVADVRLGPAWAAVRDGNWSGMPIPACVHLARELAFGARPKRKR